MTYKIEKEVPIPAPYRKAQGSKYPFAQMAVGDSFAVDVEDGEGPAAVLNRMRGAANRFGKDNGMTLTARVMGSTVRIWRTK
ncbi:MAG TPA: hypothetical protein DCS05_05440 [Nitrospiraceae bacterium]|nr:hypothetical protein [Nitrospiraceae bacterium]